MDLIEASSTALSKFSGLNMVEADEPATSDAKFDAVNLDSNCEGSIVKIIS